MTEETEAHFLRIASVINAFIADKCDHPQGKDLPNRAVCRRCAIAYAEKRVGDEIEILYQAIGERQMSCFISLIRIQQALREASGK